MPPMVPDRLLISHLVNGCRSVHRSHHRQWQQWSRSEKWVALSLKAADRHRYRGDPLKRLPDGAEPRGHNASKPVITSGRRNHGGYDSRQLFGLR